MQNHFTQHEAQYKASVMYNTWGHLDARPGEIYTCSFYVAVGDRDYTIFCENNTLCGGEGGGGPAYSSDINNFVFKKLMESEKPEGVYHFQGTYQLPKKRKPDSEMFGFFRGCIKPVKLRT